MRKLFVIMPSVNCFELSSEAYRSVKESELVDTEYKFMLVDQESEDDVRYWLSNFPETLYVRHEPKLALSAAWNNAVRSALDWGATHILIINNDVYLHPKTIKHLMAFIDHTGYMLVTADNIQQRMSLETMLKMELPVEYTDYDCEVITDWRAEGPDFSCFMITPKTIEVIGYFDENFKMAYCEDWDYHARINRARVHAELYNDQVVQPDKIHAKRLSTAPYYHYASQTMVRNHKLRHDISVQHGKNQNYYLTKWGADHPLVMDGKGNIQPFGDATKNWRDW